MAADKKKRKIIIFTELKKGSFNLAKKLLLYFLDDEVKILFYSAKSRKFFDGDREIENLKSYLVKADLIFNLIPVKLDDSRKLSDLADKLKVDYLENNLSTRLLFFSKNNLKAFLKKFNIKSPVFRLLPNEEPEKVFASFPQPSRIFSKSNLYFSGKIDSVERMKEVFQEIGENRGDYIIEEYIEGRDAYSLVMRREEEIIVYNFPKTLSAEGAGLIEKSLKESSEKIFKDFSIDKFALIHYKINKIGSLYLLNIFTELNILLGEKELIMKKIFENEGLELKDFFKILESNLKKKERNLLSYL